MENQKANDLKNVASAFEFEGTKGRTNEKTGAERAGNGAFDGVVGDWLLEELKREINDLCERISEKERLENVSLKRRIEELYAENLRLKG